MTKKTRHRDYKGKVVRVGRYEIRADAYNWIVTEYNEKDTSHHLSSDNGKDESAGSVRYYNTFETMWNGILEAETKLVFQRSGLEKVYSTALKNLIEATKV